MEQIEAYIPRANQFMLVDTLDYNHDLFKLLRVAPPPLNPDLLHYHFSKWSLQPNLRRVYSQAIAQSENVTLLLHANVTDLILQPGTNYLKSISFRSLEGQSGSITANNAVLCVGGIETARLLLACRHQRPAGLGNENDLVGRFFQDHPAALAGELKTHHGDRIQHLFNVFHHGKRRYSTRLSLSEKVQREQRLLNASASVMFHVSETSPYTMLRGLYHQWRQRALGVETVTSALRCLAVAPQLGRSLAEFVFRRRTFTPGARFIVSMVFEQEPNPHSRVRLSTKTDALGMPRSEICWSLTPASARTARIFASLLAQELKRIRLGHLQLADWLVTPEADWQNKLSDQNHHMGTARMSASPREGVVNTDCRLHSVDNVYVISTAVFPTGGHSNPTLTMIALAKRLAAYFISERTASTALRQDTAPYGSQRTEAQRMDAQSR
jgi:choline dehydrogenase-like flavoprotein